MATSLILFGLIYATTAQHSGHQHTSEIPDCECTTGISTDDLDIMCDGSSSDGSSSLEQLQAYLVENNCDQYCAVHTMMNEDHMMYIGTTEPAFKCFQAYTNLIQYHDFCPSGSVNETLLHLYLSKCPDCLQKHYEYESAAECDGALNCTDIADQEYEISFIQTNCITACGTGCTDAWQTVEGYHRMCAHTELSEEFDTLYDSLAWTETVCTETEIHCNVPWEDDYEADCSSDLNKEYKSKLDMYGEFDLDESGISKHFTVFAGILSVFATFFV